MSLQFKTLTAEVIKDPKKQWRKEWIFRGEYTICTLTFKPTGKSYTVLTRCSALDIAAGLFSAETGSQIALGKCIKQFYLDEPKYVRIQDLIAQYNAQGVVVTSSRENVLAHRDLHGIEELQRTVLLEDFKDLITEVFVPDDEQPLPF